MSVPVTLWPQSGLILSGYTLQLESLVQWSIATTIVSTVVCSSSAVLVFSVSNVVLDSLVSAGFKICVLGLMYCISAGVGSVVVMCSA